MHQLKTFVLFALLLACLIPLHAAQRAVVIENITATW